MICAGQVKHHTYTVGSRSELSLQPFSACDNPAIVNRLRYDKISKNTLIKSLRLLPGHVEKMIAAKLSAKSSLELEAWSSADTHYMAVFSTYPYTLKIGFSKVLLVLFPFKDEGSLCAQEHLNYVTFLLSSLKIVRQNCLLYSGKLFFKQGIYSGF